MKHKRSNSTKNKEINENWSIYKLIIFHISLYRFYFDLFFSAAVKHRSFSLFLFKTSLFGWALLLGISTLLGFDIKIHFSFLISSKALLVSYYCDFDLINLFSFAIGELIFVQDCFEKWFFLWKGLLCSNFCK